MPFGFELVAEVSLIGAIDGEGCEHESTLKYYGLLIWVPFAIYLMVGQFVICEEYFVPVLSQLGDRWNMAEDVQGATLLAIGSSSPELFTAVLGALLLADENPGPGTNVGSAVFNMCIIIGLSAIFAPRVAKLAIVPFLRDSICYMLGIVMLFGFYIDGEMQWWESLLLVGWWVLYVAVVVRTDLLAVRCCCCVPSEEVNKVVELESVAASKPDGDYVALGGSEDNDAELLHRPSYNRAKSVITTRGGKRGVLYDEQGHPVADTEQNPDNIRIVPGTIAEEAIDEELQQLLDALNRKQRQNVNKGWMVVVVPAQQAQSGALGFASSAGNDGVVRDDVVALNSAQRPHGHAYVRRATLMETLAHERELEEIDDHGKEEEHGHGSGVLHKMLVPWVKIFHWTLPRPDGEFVTNHIFVTISLIVAWLGILTFFVVDAATKIGACLTIPADLLGVTLLAIGSSLPDCISSVIVARQMKIDAAVANAFGSNIFDANLAVGFAFALGSINNIKEGGVVYLGDEHAVNTFVQLIVTAAGYLVIYWLMMWCTIFRLEKWIGYVLLVMYVGFVIVFSILFTGDEYKELVK